jgi:hypothetical protein
LWLHGGESAWHFVTLPKGVADRIKRISAARSQPFGMVKVQACLGESRWRTSIFPDQRFGSYLLPIKAAVRRREQIRPGAVVEVLLIVF